MPPSLREGRFFLVTRGGDEQFKLVGASFFKKKKKKAVWVTVIFITNSFISLVSLSIPDSRNFCLDLSNLKML